MVPQVSEMSKIKSPTGVSHELSTTNLFISILEISFLQNLHAPSHLGTLHAAGAVVLHAGQIPRKLTSKTTNHTGFLSTFNVDIW